MSISIRQTANILAFILILIGSANIFSVYYVRQELTIQAQWVKHTYDILRTTNLLYMNLMDAETGQRGFLLTEKNEYLQPFYRANQQIPDLIANLDQLTQHHDEQNQRVMEIKQSIAAKMQELHDALELVHQGQKHHALKQIESTESHELMDQIRQQLNLLLNIERQLLHQHENALVELEQRSYDLLISLITVIFLVIAFLLYWFGRQLLAPIFILIRRIQQFKKTGTLKAIRRRPVTDEIAALNHEFEDLVVSIQSQQQGLKENIRAAQAATEAKSAFLATMSHEIRTPLNAIIGTTYLMGLSPLQDHQQNDLKTIEVASKNLLNLINNILDFSKIEAGELTLDPQHFNLNEVLDDLKLMFTHIAEGKGLVLNIPPLPADVPAARIGDSHRLKQMLINLLSNAIKFTHEGTVILKVNACLLTDEAGLGHEALDFVVIDNGIGMNEATLHQLFIPFCQGDVSSTRQFEGTGLGLSIVKKLADLMQGHIRVSSEPGRGSAFTLTLPFAIAEQPPPPYLSESATTQARMKSPYLPLTSDQNQKQRLKDMYIVIVDDSTMNLNIVQRILENEGAMVQSFLSGLDVLEYWRQSPRCDVILMDIQMPEMDGFEVSERLRQQCQCSVPIIALSADARTVQIHQARLAGMTDFISKPVNPDELIRILSHHVTLASSSRVASDSEDQPVSKNWPEITGIDSDTARQMFDGDQPFFIEMLGFFLTENAEVVDRIRTLMEAQDLNAAHKLAHKVRGQAGNIGALKLQQVAGTLEHALIDQSENIESVFNEFSMAHQEIFHAKIQTTKD